MIDDSRHCKRHGMPYAECRCADPTEPATPRVDPPPWPFPTGKPPAPTPTPGPRSTSPAGRVSPIAAKVKGDLTRAFQDAELRALLRRCAVVHGWDAVINAAIAEREAIKARAVAEQREERERFMREWQAREVRS